MQRTGEGSEIHTTHSSVLKTPITDFLGLEELSNSELWLLNKEDCPPDSLCLHKQLPPLSHLCICTWDLPKETTPFLPRKAFKKFKLGVGRYLETSSESIIPLEAVLII